MNGKGLQRPWNVRGQLQKWKRLFRLWAILCIGVAFAAAGAAAPAEVVPLVIDPAATQVDLSNATYLLEDPEGTLTIEEVVKPENASRLTRTTPSQGNTPSALWLRWTVHNPGDTALERWLDTGNRMLQEVDLYVPDGQGGFQHIVNGSRLRFGDRPLPTNTFVFPISIRAGQTVDLYLRVRCTGYFAGAVLPSIWKADAFQAKSENENAIFFAMLGFMAALIVVNVFLFFFNRDPNSLLYVLSVAAWAFGLLSANGGYGAAYEHFWPDSPVFEQAAWVAAIGVAGVLPGVFILNLIGIPNDRPKLARAVYAIWVLMSIPIGYQVLATALQWQGQVATLQTAYAIGAVPWGMSFVALVYCLVTEVLAGNRSARFVAVGFVPILICLVAQSYLSFVHGLSVLEPLIVAAIFEMLVMAAAVADRFKQIRLQAAQERAQAQASLVEGLRKSEHELEGKVEQRTRELQAEQARTTEMLQQNQELLHNMLPSDIADELSATGTARPARHESVSVLFTDFTGFTQAAAAMPADQMVSELNEVFAAFDDICDDCGVEKIKTIGDAYMAAAGLPKPSPDHAQRCVRAGLRMVEYVALRNSDSAFKWALRVGIHSGPVVAGVVGKRKYAFDIWGDTVNLASRMESAGEPGRVNVSAYTYHLIRKDFDCEYRGKVSAKGKGEVDMYFVAGAKA